VTPPASAAAARILAEDLDRTIPSALVRLAHGCAGAAAAQPAFAWRPEHWRARVGSLDGLPERAVHDGVMSRAEPARLAHDVAHGVASPRSFLIAAMVWGFGDRGYGPWRTSRMLATPRADDRVEEVLRLVRLEGALPAYEALAGPYRLDRMGPVFATKLRTSPGRARTGDRSGPATGGSGFGTRPASAPAFVAHSTRRSRSLTFTMPGTRPPSSPWRTGYRRRSSRTFLGTRPSR
jgi:hypothetical protein